MVLQIELTSPMDLQLLA